MLTEKGEIEGSLRIEGRRLCVSMVGGETGEMETGSNQDVSALRRRTERNQLTPGKGIYPNAIGIGVESIALCLEG